MIFTEEENIILNKLKSEYPIVKKITDEISLYESNSVKVFHKSLLHITGSLSSEFDDIIKGNSVYKYRLLESKPIVWKRIFSLLINSKKIMSGLAETKDLVSGDSKVIKKETQITEDEPVDDGISLTDKMANQKNK